MAPDLRSKPSRRTTATACCCTSLTGGAAAARRSCIDGGSQGIYQYVLKPGSTRCAGSRGSI